MSKKSSGVIAYFKGLTKRQRIIWIVAVVLVAALIAGAIALIVIFTREDETEQTLKRKEYYYAVTPTDGDGIVLDDGFTVGLPREDFTFKVLKEVPGISVSEDMVLTSSSAAVGSVAEFSYTYGDVEIAKISVEVVAADAIKVADAIQLGNIANGSGTYILTSDIDVSALTTQIAGFKGRLFGNHRKISGNLPKGGLFSEVNGAEIKGMELAVDSEMVYTTNEIPADGLNVGVLASHTSDADISECYVTGKLSVQYQTSSRNVNVRIGGLIGFAEAGARSNLNTSVHYLRQCESELDLSVSGNGAVYLGGIYGMALNAGASNLRTFGSVSFTGSAPSVSALNVGGIGGLHRKEYGAQIAAGHELENTNRTYFYGEMNINLTDTANSFYIKAGGIFGVADTLSMTNSEFHGKISITSNAPVIAGGIVGEAHSDLNATMRLNGIKSAGSMVLNVTGEAYGGGVAGSISGNTEYMGVVASFTPEIIGGIGENRIVDPGAAKTE